MIRINLQEGVTNRATVKHVSTIKHSRQDSVENDDAEETALKEADDHLDDHKLLISALIDYQEETLRIKFCHLNLEFQTVSLSLWYRTKKLPEEILDDVTEEESSKESYSGSKVYKKSFDIYLDKVNRHVLYKTFKLIYKYSFLKDDSETYESQFEIEVSFAFTFNHLEVISSFYNF